MTVPVEYQKNIVEELEKERHTVQTFELETGHCANFTATEGEEDAVNKVVLGQCGLTKTVPACIPTRTCQ
jgi:hypothetical protein